MFASRVRRVPPDVMRGLEMPEPKTTGVLAHAPRFATEREAWPEWMAPEPAAQYVDSSVSTLAKLRLRGGGPAFCRIGRAIRYRRRDLDAWLLSTSRRSTTDTGRG
ncbi:MAG: helix-turn-helix domain-containing protein [Hyphomicrobiaceae bacterium]